MGEYEDTLEDIKQTFGVIPNFMKAIPKGVLIQDWPLMKRALVFRELSLSWLQMNSNPNSTSWQISV